MKEKALKLADSFDSQAKALYDLVLENEDTESNVAQRLMGLHVDMAKEYEENAKLIRSMVAVLDKKPLSDEEIDHVWFNYGWGSVEKDDLIKFARAILKKAREG